METLARFCVFCGKELPGGAERKSQGRRASWCPSCNTIDIYQYFRPCERARLRIEARRGRSAEREIPAPGGGQADELLSLAGGGTRNEEPPAEASIDVATLLPFRMGAPARQTPAAPARGAPSAGGEPAADACPGAAGGREAVEAGASCEDGGTMALPPEGDSADEYVTMQIDRPFSARLVLTVGDAEPAEIILREGTLVLGGVQACDVVVNTPQLTISRRHALLRCSRGEGGQPEVSVEDLNSRNGTLVNGVKITAETALKPGDKVAFADATYRLER